jgi:hypothetical protein
MKEYQPFVRIKSTESDCIQPSEVTIYGIKSGVKDNELLTEGLVLSTGKVRSPNTNDGEAFFTINPKTGYGETRTTGTGRIELTNFSKNPSLQVKSGKKQRRIEKHDIYAEISVKTQDSEIIDGVPVQYFDLKMGLKHSDRSLMPHIGFRPSGSSHFYVKTEELGITHESFGEILAASGLVLPKYIMLSSNKFKHRVQIKFKYCELSNQLLADEIDIV